MVRNAQEEGTSRLGFATAACILTAVVAWLALGAGHPPPPQPRSAPADRFSALRAMEHVEVLARAPRPVGTAAHAAAAEYLVAQLEALGLETQMQETTWLSGAASRRQGAVRVRNILARREGRASRGALLLMAHYDSQPQTFGAGDDAAGVATILEVLRAVVAEEPMANELVVAITDAEELGLYGAEAFVAQHPWFERVRRTLNFEGRGQTGVALMFETATGGLESARDLARQAPFPAASSTSYEVYRRMPNDTDFSVVRRAGGHGLNFAFIGGLPAYHSRLDTAARLDRATLQHLGDNALAMVRYYGASDLAPAAEAEGVYFNPWGLRPLWVFSALTARVAALAVLALGLLVTFALHSRGDLSLRRLPAGWALVLVAAGAAMALTWAAWRSLGRTGATPYGIPYAEGLAAFGLCLIALATWFYCSSFRRGGPWELLASLSLLWGLLGVASAFYMPGVSHLFVGPAALAGLGLALGYRTGSPWPTVLVGLLPSVLLWAPALQLSYLALTVRAAMLLAPIALLAATLAMPLAAWLGPRHRRIAAGLALAAGLGCLGWAVHGEPAAGERPRVDSLFALYDRESDETTWFTLDAEVDSWTAQVLGAKPRPQALPEALDRDQRELLSASAELPPPPETLTVVRERDERPAGGRRVAVRIRSESAANLRLWVHAQVALDAVYIDGQRCNLDADGELRLALHGRAPEGFLLEAEMGDRWPLYIEVVEVSYGLPAGVSERPVDRIPLPGWWSDTTMVKTGFTL